MVKWVASLQLWRWRHHVSRKLWHLTILQDYALLWQPYILHRKRGVCVFVPTKNDRVFARAPVCQTGWIYENIRNRAWMRIELMSTDIWQACRESTPHLGRFLPKRFLWCFIEGSLTSASMVRKGNDLVRLAVGHCHGQNTISQICVIRSTWGQKTPWRCQNVLLRP